MMISNGVIYVGEWKNNEPHGVGELFFPNDAYYIGTFKNGNVDG